ncbi:MAG TPA: hypothetical protein VFL70_02715, partial [Bacteroidia bacterium]|nr:hypothetical protein [Bacteroidia bacterium]
MPSFSFKIVRSLLVVLLLFIYIHIRAQNKNTGWTTNSPLHQKVFIENNRQWDGMINTRTKILFGTSQQGIDMYLTPQGLTYKITEYHLSERAKREMKKNDNHEEWKEEVRAKYHYLSMEWVNPNLSALVLAEEPVSNYYTYSNPTDRSGKSGIKANAYKKIIYKNIYPGIDVEYILPEKEGIKYSFIVHPGADPSLIKLQYNEADKINLNSQGEIEIHSATCGDYLEHQPETYYQNGSSVKSGFYLQGKTIGFNIPSYDKSKTLVIDPWVSIVNFPPGTNPSTSAFNTSAYAVSYDNNGNVWVYGGADPVYLSKYSNTGALLWSYQVPFSSWDLVGDFDVNRYSGTAYVCAGSDCTPANPGGLPAGIVKVNSNGIQTGLYAGHAMNREISRIRINCDGNLYMTGGGVQKNLWQVANIDTNLTGPMTGAHITTSANGDHDECLMALDPAGNFMYVNFNHPAANSADFLHDNEMQKVPLPTYLPAAWVNPGPVHAFVEMASLKYAGIADGGMLAPPAGARINIFNGMVCGNTFLYTYDGNNLKQWNKSTGTLIKQITTGGTMFESGGIDMDFCENLYVGVSNKINVYDSTFTFVTSYPLNQTTCYDLKVDKNNQFLYACGKGYVSSTYIPLNTIKTLTTSVTPSSCNDCNGTAAATYSVSMPTTCGSIPFNYSYHWLPGGQTTSSITGLCAGTYTVVAEAISHCLTPLTDTSVVIITGGSGVVANYSNNIVCFNNPTLFTNLSTGTSATTQWQWNFGDGNT